MIFRTKDKNKL